jgi:hypothetical protein
LCKYTAHHCNFEQGVVTPWRREPRGYSEVQTHYVCKGLQPLVHCDGITILFITKYFISITLLISLLRVLYIVLVHRLSIYWGFPIFLVVPHFSNHHCQGCLILNCWYHLDTVFILDFILILDNLSFFDILRYKMLLKKSCLLCIRTGNRIM